LRVKKPNNKKSTKRKKTNVLIVGAGKAGVLLIDMFHKSKTVNIAGVVDKDTHAAGMRLARQFKIPTSTHYKKFLKKKNLDEIINVTGSTRIQSELLACKPSHVEVIGGQSAKLIWELVEERKHIEENLQKSEEKFRLAFENARDAIFWADTKTGIIVNCNKAAEALVEKKRDEIIGRHQSELHPSKDKNLPSDSFRKHVRKNFQYDLEAEVITKSGKIKPVIITPSITFVGGEHIIQGIFHDISNHKIAEEIIRKSEEKYRDLYDNAPDMYHTLDKDGIIIDCNETEARMLGYKKNEMIGKPVTHFFTDISKKLFKNDFPRLNRERRLLNLEREYVRKDGSTFPAMLNVFSEYDEDGNFLKAKTISRDITLLKFAEKALRDSEQKYRNLVDNALVGIFQTSLEGDIIYVNEAFSKLLEFSSPEAMMSESVLTMYEHPGDRDVLIKNLLRENKVNGFECALLTNTGKTIHVLISATLSKDIISGMIMDITEHKRAEEKITFLAQVLNTSPLSVIATNERGKIIYVNPATEKLYGYKDYELLGKSPTMLNEDSYTENLQKTILATARQNKVWTGELLNRKKNGELFYVKETIYQLTDGKGDFIAFVGFAEDITDRKKLEEQLFQAQKMEAVGQLAGGIAHDFNNILTAIIGYGNLLKTEMHPDNHLLAMYIQRILTSAQRAANLTRSLLTFSRTQVINAIPCDLNGIVRGMSELLSRIIGESIELSTMLTNEELRILADSSQIELVLMNLATNAMDAMPDGGKLTIRTERISSANNLTLSYDPGPPFSYALISIEDTGQGMEKHTREHVLEPFFSTKEVGRGTGLGLSMSYGIIKQHNGHIDIHSEPGKGTTFKIFFPLIQPGVQKEISKRSITGTGQETILVAEDDVQVRELVKQLLELYGYNVIVAKDGEDALETFTKNEHKIQLLLLDVIMPKKNGKEVYDIIKKRNPKIKAIFISGYSSDIIHKKGILEEGLDFLSKPILQETLLTKVREVLDR